MRSGWRQTTVNGIVIGVVLIISLPSHANLGSVADLFLSARYEEARQTLTAGSEGARPGEEALWRAQLAATPDEALQFLESNQEDDRLPPFVRQKMHLEMARLHFARGAYRSTLADLGFVLEEGQENVPGEAYLLAGMSYRLLGDLQASREMLASVRPSDPAFSRARYQLGDIGLQMGDAALAKRYFASGDQQGQDTRRPDLLAGLWRSHREAGEESMAEDILERLQNDAPGSLPLLNIHRITREENEDLLARAVVNQVPDTTVTRPVDHSGRYSLQLGAFSDRRLALEYVRRLESQLPDLRIDEVRDDRGQFLYKVRTGSFVNPALARTEAARLRRSLDTDVIVVDQSSNLESGD